MEPGFCQLLRTTKLAAKARTTAEGLKATGIQHQEAQSCVFLSSPLIPFFANFVLAGNDQKLGCDLQRTDNSCAKVRALIIQSITMIA